MNHLSDRISRLLLLGLLVVVSGLFALVLVQPSWWWPLEHHAAPGWPTLAWGGAFLATALLCAGRRLRIPRNIALAGLLFGLYTSLRAYPLGDFKIWRTVADTDTLYASELLACLFLRIANGLDGMRGVNLVQPIAGGVTALAFFFFCDWYFGPSRRVQRLTAVAFLATGFHLLFTVAYTECTQLAMPFAIAFIFFVVRIARRAPQGSTTRDTCLAAGAVALAALVHGQCLFLLPALPIVVVIARRGFVAAGRELAAAVATFSAVVGGVVGALALAGFSFGRGYVQGGGGGPFIELADLWPDKLQHVANAALLVGPVLLFWPWIVRAAWRSRARHDGHGRWALHFLVGGAVFFVCLWDFDLGFPADYDLMVSILLPLHIALVELMLVGLNGGEKDRPWRGRAVAAAAAALVFGGIAAWSVIGSLTLEERAITFGPDAMRHHGGRPVLELRLTEAGALEVSIENRPARYEEGWVLFSYRTDVPLGAGGMFGLEPDHLTVTAWLQKTEPGSILHFARPDGDVFPNRPAAIPAMKVRESGDLAVDAVAVFAVGDERVIAVSNLVRFQP